MSKVMKPNISELRQAYSRGDNITQLLTNSNAGLARSEIIEIALPIKRFSVRALAIHCTSSRAIGGTRRGDGPIQRSMGSPACARSMGC